MKVLLDECVPVDFRHHVTGHEVFTATYAVVTTDANVEHQINPATMPLAVVIFRVPSNNLADLLPLVPQLLSELGTLKPRTFTHVRRAPVASCGPRHSYFLLTS